MTPASSPPPPASCCAPARPPPLPPASPPLPQLQPGQPRRPHPRLPPWHAPLLEPSSWRHAPREPIEEGKGKESGCECKGVCVDREWRCLGTFLRAARRARRCSRRAVSSAECVRTQSAAVATLLSAMTMARAHTCRSKPSATKSCRPYHAYVVSEKECVHVCVSLARALYITMMPGWRSSSC